MDLRQRVRKVLTETELSDPREIAESIIGDLRGRAVRDALVECLPEYVRTVLSGERSMQRLGLAHTRNDDQTIGSGSSRSSKWEAVGRLFREPMFVGEWKQLGDLTVEDLTWVVEDRDKKAKELMATRDRYAALRDLMIRQQVTRVRDLDEGQVREVLA